VPVTDAVLADPDRADWLMINRTYDEQRFSPLKEINTGNVAQLRMAWSRGLPAGTQESTPIVYRGVMYLYAPGGGIQAVDAASGDLIWEYRRSYPQGVSGTAARSKSIAIYEDMIYFAAPDGFLLALDARSGRLRAGAAGQLLHRGARREDRPRIVEVLRHRGTRRARRRQLGQYAGGAARGGTVGPAGLL
jgi:alcohol dehydrogenase (cytochrome c)